MSRNGWLFGLVTLMLGFTIAVPALAGLRTGTRSLASIVQTEQGLQVSILTIVSLCGLGALGFETRKRARLQQLIRQERDVSRRLRDGSANGVVVVDPQLRVIDWNPAIEQLTGLPRSRARRMLLTDCPGFNHPRHLECLKLALHGLEIATDAPSWQHEDGEVAPAFRGYYSPVKDADGHICKVMAIVTASRHQHTRDARPAEANGFELPAA